MIQLAERGCGVQQSATDPELEHVKAMSNSLLVLQSEHTELLKCVRTTSTVLRDVASVLRSRHHQDACSIALGKLRHVCRSLDALAGLASSQMHGGMEYDDEVDMDRALEGFSTAFDEHEEKAYFCHQHEEEDGEGYEEEGAFQGDGRAASTTRSASRDSHSDAGSAGCCCFAGVLPTAARVANSSSQSLLDQDCL
jgi:hypothetical protein